MKTAAVALALSNVTIPGFAEENINLHLPSGSSIGIGAYDCQHVIDWIERGDDPRVVTSWVWGYWSAFNIFEVSNNRPARDLFSEFDDPLVLEHVLLGRCYEDREQLFVQVAIEVFGLLSRIDGNENSAVDDR